MNQPASGDGNDDMERRFHSGLQEDGGPSETVRRAILEHARLMAIEHARSQRRPPTMLAARRRRTIFGALAAAVFAGLLVVPILRAPVALKQSRVAATSNRHAAPQPAQAPGPQSSQAPTAEPAPAPAAQLAPAPAPQSSPGPQLAQAPAPQSSPGPQREEVQRSDTTNSVAGVQRRTTAGAKTAAPTSADAAAAPPAYRNLAPAAISPDERGESLRRASAAGDLAAVNALLGSAADVDARDRSGRTALMLAIMNGHADVVDALLAHGAAVDAVAPGGVRPLQIARAKGNAEIIDSLLRAGAR